MTQDEIIEMAMEAEFVLHGKPSEEESELFVCVDKDIVRFAKLVASKERESLAQTQEPVVKLKTSNMLLRCHRCGCSDKLNIQIEYTTPPQRTWVGLTNDEVERYWDWEDFQTGAGRSTIFEMVRDIEAKLKEKNT